MEEITLSVSAQATIIAFEKGYRSDGYKVVSPSGETLKLREESGGYPCFGIRDKKRTFPVKVHRLIAFQKYGIRMFRKGIEVRHLNGNQKDFSLNNIAIGTSSDNARDKSPEERLRVALIATSFAKKHNHENVLDLYRSGKTYEQIMKETGISSKGTIHFIVKKSVAMKK